MKAIALLVLAYIATVATAAPVECPEEHWADWGVEVLLPHDDCDKFYKCTHGQPIEKICPEGLYFDVDTTKCEWRSEVNCTGRRIPGEETTISPTPEPDTTPEPETDTTPVSVPDTTPEPETNTTPGLENDTTPVPEPDTTPEPETDTTPGLEPDTTPGLETDTTPVPEPDTTPESETDTTTGPEPDTTPVPESDTTPVPEPESTPIPEPETTLVPEPETTPIPEPEVPDIEFQENGCPVDRLIHWLLPDEEDCNLFYYCVWGTKVLRECPSMLHFNRFLQVCDWPVTAGCLQSFNKHLESRRMMTKHFK